MDIKPQQTIFASAVHDFTGRAEIVRVTSTDTLITASIISTYAGTVIVIVTTCHDSKYKISGLQRIISELEYNTYL